jgi:hypothetical protein
MVLQTTAKARRRTLLLLTIGAHISLFLGVPCLAQEKDSGPRIVLGYQTIGKWATSAETVPVSDRNKLFEKLVIETLHDDCFAGRALPADPMQMIGMAFGNPAGWDLKQVKREIGLLDGTKKTILEAVTAGLKHSQLILSPNGLSRVCVLYFSPDNPVRTRMNGVMGFTPGKDLIDLYVSPGKDLNSWIVYNAAHEYHHAAWMYLSPERDPYGFTLLEYLIFEGRADSFANKVTKITAPWTHAIAPTLQCQLLTLLKPSLGMQGAILPKVMFGDGDKYPTWTGYTIGYEIVQSFLRVHPAVPALDWTKMGPSRLFDESLIQTHCGQI